MKNMELVVILFLSFLLVGYCDFNRVPGSISKEKCREYAKYVYVKSKPPILLLDAEETVKRECGHEVVELVLGGTEAKAKEFPHMAVLGYKVDPHPQILWACGGSLISPEFVLTAGHCLDADELGLVKYVRLGLTKITDRNHQQFTIKERIPYPEYTAASLYNDIALIRLEKSVTPTAFVRPACLFTNPTIPTRKAIATGWGVTGPQKSFSNALRKVTLDFFTVDRCNETFKSSISERFRNGILMSSQLCAGSMLNEEVKDTCDGDSGGPLQIYHAHDDVDCMYDIVGVTSFGKKCGSKSPGVYTRVATYIKWIEDVVWIMN